MSKFILFPAILLIIVAILGFSYYETYSNQQDNIQANKLLTNSKAEYNQIVDVDYAEVQQLPPISQTGHVNVQPSQIYVPILMYHHININPKPSDPTWASLFVTPTLLDSELQYLSSHNYHTISLDDLYNALQGQQDLPTNPVVLTFDDGYQDFFDNAFQLIKKYNMKATEFVITEVETAPAYLSWDEIKQLDASGLITIGDHTQHHPFLTNLSDYYANQEIAQSKVELEHELGKTVKWFAYPYGAYNASIVHDVKAAGYVGAVTTNYGAVQDLKDIYTMSRIMADGRFTLDEFAARIQNK